MMYFAFSNPQQTVDSHTVSSILYEKQVGKVCLSECYILMVLIWTFHLVDQIRDCFIAPTFYPFCNSSPFFCRLPDFLPMSIDILANHVYVAQQVRLKCSFFRRKVTIEYANLSKQAKLKRVSLHQMPKSHCRKNPYFQILLLISAQSHILLPNKSYLIKSLTLCARLSLLP